MLGVKINVKNMDYWSENAVSFITNIVMSGDDSIDACFLGVMNNITAISNGIYVDLNEIDEFDFDKPWWDKTSAKYYEIDGKLFTAHNEASANIHDSVWTCFFNKTIAGNELDEDIYQIVRDGEWTIDKMREIIENTTHDLNGDGNLTVEDQWGLVTHNGAAFGFLHGCDARGIDIEKGVPYVCKVDDKLYNAILGIQSIYNMDGVMTNDKHQSSFGLTCVQQFANGNGTILVEVLGNAASLRDMDTDFGIIPYPKYDEAQSDYVAYYSPAANGFCIPKTARDLSMTGTVIEVMSALGYQNVRPAYYNVVLTGKTARDDESVEMLDIIFSNIECEMAYLYQWGGYSNSLKSVMTGSVDIISTLESMRESTENAIAKYIEALK